MKIDVSTGMAYIHISPPTLRTLTACLMSLAPAKVCTDCVSLVSGNSVLEPGFHEVGAYSASFFQMNQSD